MDGRRNNTTTKVVKSGPKKKLTAKPARTDLTDRECTKLLGSVIGGLCLMACHQTVRDAVRWWAESDKAWDALANCANHENL